MNALVADLQSAAWDRDVKLVLDASTELAARFDANLLQQGLSSLLAELIRVAPRDGTIAVVTAFEPRSAMDDAPSAADAADQVKIEITGASPLGLQEAAVQQFLNAVSCCLGTASLEPASDPQGARIFTARLAGRRATAPGIAQRTAVVVDDDVDMQDFLGAVLRRLGFNVVAVNDGFDALIVLERVSPAVILTDVMMPNMNGIDLVNRIKQVRDDLPIIVFSGYHETLAQKVKDRSLRADYVLPKPMSTKEVATALASVLKDPTIGRSN